MKLSIAGKSVDIDPTSVEQISLDIKDQSFTVVITDPASGFSTKVVTDFGDVDPLHMIDSLLNLVEEVGRSKESAADSTMGNITVTW